jgi:N-methylhydantoinase A
MVAALRKEAEAWLDGEHVPNEDRRIEIVALMRYAGQGSELPVAWTADPDVLCRDFAAAHATLYGFTLDTPVELVTLRVEASGRFPAPAPATLPARGEKPRMDETIVHYCSGPIATPIASRTALPAGFAGEGPVIITQVDATTLVPPGWSIAVHRSGALLLRRL